MAHEIIYSVANEVRLRRAESFLLACRPQDELVVVGSRLDSAFEIVRRASEVRRFAIFGWHRTTLLRLATQIATRELASRGLVPATHMALEAVCGQVLESKTFQVGKFAACQAIPAFARSVLPTLLEARLSGVNWKRTDNEFCVLANAFDLALGGAGLADNSVIFRAATEALAQEGGFPMGLPLLFLDVPVRFAIEAEFAGALAKRSNTFLATIPASDETTRSHLQQRLGQKATELGSDEKSSLAILQRTLFASDETRDGDRPHDSAVLFISAPGEHRESVAIARHCLRFADRGIPFDKMAVLLRNPETYRAHLEEAFRRATIPAFFSEGTSRPDPSGRAFLALLACAREKLSAARFAEYLSLGQVPNGSGRALSENPIWEKPNLEFARSTENIGFENEGTESGSGNASSATSAILRTPRRFEKLLTDARVIGGLDRWRNRLAVLRKQLTARLRLRAEEHSGANLEAVLDDLGQLEAFALPLLEQLAALPERANYGIWQDRLSKLAVNAICKPERILSTLAELSTVERLSEVNLRTIETVLSKRLLELRVPPDGRRFGKVYVGTVEDARGMSFSAVFIPGLAERGFPRKVVQDPILLDRERMDISPLLKLNSGRIAEERERLLLSVSAATEAVVFSYPRVDIQEGRGRVPSFYALEALRAKTGILPSLEEFAREAEANEGTRIRVAAPILASEAIDDAEHDLAIVDEILRGNLETKAGAARHLLDVNSHLGRALRFRARRWIRRLTPADGLVDPHPSAQAALLAYSLKERAYAPTSLEAFGACPYKFFLSSIVRLHPRSTVGAIDDVGPLERGLVLHEIHFRLFQRLQELNQLPIRSENLALAEAELSSVLKSAEREFRDDLSPTVDRVWETSIARIHADLVGWIRALAKEQNYIPWKFEFAFGLESRCGASQQSHDPGSTPIPVVLDEGFRLSGAIDLIEKGPEERLRATDLKAGKKTAPRGAIVGGGELLQPTLYALALEKLFSSARIDGTRLAYLGGSGGLAEHFVALNPMARDAASQVLGAIEQSLQVGMLPAYPTEKACDNCMYARICGPSERERTGRKHSPQLARIAKIRELP